MSGAKADQTMLSIPCKNQKYKIEKYTMEARVS
jgi:hypothetical protein